MHTTSTAGHRRRISGTRTSSGRSVLVGQKDFYDIGNAADRAEYQTVMRYTHR